MLFKKKKRPSSRENTFATRVMPILLAGLALLFLAYKSNALPENISTKIDTVLIQLGYSTDKDDAWSGAKDKDQGAEKAKSSKVSASKPYDTDGLTIEFIDVGQADCVFLCSEDRTMLIDAGNNGDGYKVAEYLHKQGVDTIDYLIVTHAHEDHCGGSDEIMEKMKVKNIMLPLVSTDTKAYDDVLSAAKKEKATSLKPKVGDTYTLGDASWTILCCSKKYGEKELNRSSIVIKMIDNDFSAILGGDAEIANEYDMLDASPALDLDCTLFKAGHHGSKTSNSISWLKAITPKTIVVSVGNDNDYNLPNDTTMDHFARFTDDIYRTDRDGTVRVHTDGNKYEITTYHTNTDAQAA